MRSVTEKTTVDRGNLFLGVILVALVVIVCALIMAATRPAAERAAIRVNHVGVSWLAPNDFRPATMAGAEPIHPSVIDVLWA